MQKYTKNHSFKTSEKQKEFLKNMSEYKMNPSKFIREAIEEKQLRDGISFKITKKEVKYSGALQNALNQLKHIEC